MVHKTYHQIHCRQGNLLCYHFNLTFTVHLMSLLYQMTLNKGRHQVEVYNTEPSRVMLMTFPRTITRTLTKIQNIHLGRVLNHGTTCTVCTGLIQFNSIQFNSLFQTRVHTHVHNNSIQNKIQCLLTIKY